MASRKITCLITGKSYTYGQDYYDKKTVDYIDEDNLKKYFITQKDTRDTKHIKYQ